MLVDRSVHFLPFVASKDEAQLAVACPHYTACVLHIEIFNVRVRRLLAAAVSCCCWQPWSRGCWRPAVSQLPPSKLAWLALAGPTRC